MVSIHIPHIASRNRMMDAMVILRKKSPCSLDDDTLCDCNRWDNMIRSDLHKEGATRLEIAFRHVRL